MHVVPLPGFMFAQEITRLCPDEIVIGPSEPFAFRSSAGLPEVGEGVVVPLDSLVSFASVQPGSARST